MAQTEAQKRAHAKYEAKAKRLAISLYPSEIDLLDKISEVSKTEGYSPYIKRLIREDIAREKDNKNGN